ncbi:VOC family protein [Pseudooceanicola sp. 502str34]|uniref:VOC family protein n=1 Tax=Maritimibacter alkaliphilus TaxID=404236 RepID=UPI001C951803|nr:VOC family protein [Maritimibacter alkaliphilus]MBY6091197.1 glyoxalase [Maritimibacter alkaliphilus]
MAVRRIVANLACDDPQALAVFYRALFDLDVAMDLGFIVTLGAAAQQDVQLALASEGGSGTPVPALSIEVDDLAPVLDAARARSIAIAYGPVDEPWGVRRLMLHDPAHGLTTA